MELYIEKKAEYGYADKKMRGKVRGKFRRPPLAEFGADAARSFADHTTGVGGTGVTSRRARWRSGCRRSSAGYAETGIVRKIHLDQSLRNSFK